MSDGHIFAIAGWGGAHAGFLASIESIRVAEAGSSGSGSGSNSDASSSGSTTSCTLTSGFVSDSGDASPCVALPGWTTAAAPLHLARHCPATATLGHYLYVVGGSGTDPEDASQGAQPTASVERLDTRVLCAGWRQDITAMQVPPPTAVDSHHPIPGPRSPTFTPITAHLTHPAHYDAHYGPMSYR